VTPERRREARAYAVTAPLIWQHYLNEALDDIDRLERELAAAKAELAELVVQARPGPTEAEDQPVRARRRR
jgi:hypothetical protein